MSTTRTRTPVRSHDLDHRDCDAALLVEQIGRNTLISCGARDLIDLHHGLMMTVSKGQKLIVTLRLNDLFTIERVRKIRGSVDWVSEAFAENVHCDDLPRIVREMGDVE